MARAVPRPASAGLTLIELLIVIAIMGIIAGAVLPILFESPEKAKVAALKGDLFTLRSQMALFRIEHDGVPPGAARLAGSTVTAIIAGDGETAIATYDPEAFRAGDSAVNFGPALVAGPSGGAVGNLVDQILAATDRDGRAGSSAGTRTFGPYLRKVPSNLFAAPGKGRTFKMQHPLPSKSAAAADPDCGYLYSPYTLEVLPAGSVTAMPLSEVDSGNLTLQDL